MAKRSDSERLPFEYEVTSEDDSVTSYGGLPIVLETMRSLGVSAAIGKHVSFGKRDRVHDETSIAESLALLMAAGGDCLDDMRVLAEDTALVKLLGRALPSPETARRFLNGFHDDALIAARDEAAQLSFVPEESAPLKGLAMANRALIHSVAERKSCPIATVDLDTTIIDSAKKQALTHYKGGTGYQPMLAVWAERDLLLAEEFRDGNVTAKTGVLRVAQNAFAALPPSVTERRFRGDSACYNFALIEWLLAQNTGFTISAKLSEEFVDAMRRVPEQEWELFEERPEDRVYVANVSFAPDRAKGLEGLRYVGICVEPKQADLLDDKPLYLGIVTNREGRPGDLVRWHWEKAGTIEHVHDVLKNELAAGVLPCGRFGANAAWFRISALTYNVLSALKTVALPPDLQDARPKRLRFQVFIIPAVVVSHARKLIARVVDRLGRGRRLLAARLSLQLRTPMPAY